jgi:hypothetical protein
MAVLEPTRDVESSSKKPVWQPHLATEKPQQPQNLPHTEEDEYEPHPVTTLADSA